MVSGDNDEVAREREALRAMGRKCMDELDLPYLGKILIDTAELDPSEPQWTQMLSVVDELGVSTFDGVAWRSETGTTIGVTDG